MRTFKNLFKINTIKPVLEEYIIGYTKIYVYKNIDELEEVYFSKRIKVLFELCIYSDFQLFWFPSYEEMYMDLNEYLELNNDLKIKIILIID